MNMALKNRKYILFYKLSMLFILVLFISIVLIIDNIYKNSNAIMSTH